MVLALAAVGLSFYVDVDVDVVVTVVVDADAISSCELPVIDESYTFWWKMHACHAFADADAVYVRYVHFANALEDKDEIHWTSFVSLLCTNGGQEVRLDMVGSRKAHTTLAHSSSAGELNPLPASPPGPSGHMPLAPPPALLSSSTGGHHHSHHSHHSHHHSSSQSSCNQMQLQAQRQINSTSLCGSVNRLNLVQQTTRGDASASHGQSGGQGGNAAPSSVNIPKHLNELFGVSPSDIDKYSRVVFPVCFVCFNLMYWMIYLHISKILEDDFIVLNAD